MAASLDRIFSEISQYSKAMGSLHGDYLSIVNRDIDRFLEKTQTLTNQTRWQAFSILALTTLGASLAIAGALIPRTVVPGGAPPPPLTTLAQKLTDNDFLKTTCKTASKFFNGITGPTEAVSRSLITKTEADRSLLERINMQNGQAGKSTMDQAMSQAWQAVQRLLDTKAKGGG